MRRSRIALALALLLAAGALPAPAQPRRAGAADVKAAFVFNIAKFSRWPEEGGGDFTLCTVGENEVVVALRETLAGKSLGERPVLVVASEPESRECEVMFVAASGQERFAGRAEGTPGPATLTIGEHPRFIAAGGMVNLFVRDSRVRFEVSPTALAGSSVTLSSRLLQLAAGEVR